MRRAIATLCFGLLFVVMWAMILELFSHSCAAHFQFLLHEVLADKERPCGETGACHVCGCGGDKNAQLLPHEPDNESPDSDNKRYRCAKYCKPQCCNCKAL